MKENALIFFVQAVTYSHKTLNAVQVVFLIVLSFTPVAAIPNFAPRRV